MMLALQIADPKPEFDRAAQSNPACFRKVSKCAHQQAHSSLLNVVLHNQPHISAVNSITGEPGRKAK